MGLRKTIFGLVLSCSAAASASAPAADDLREGRWDFAFSYQMVGMEQFFLPYATSQCVSREDPLPRLDRGHQCDPSLHSHRGHQVTWLVDCSSEWEIVRGMGRVSYDDDRARGNVYVQILDPGNDSPQTMIFSVIGRYAGPCEATDTL